MRKLTCSKEQQQTQQNKIKKFTMMILTANAGKTQVQWKVYMTKDLVGHVMDRHGFIIAQECF